MSKITCPVCGSEHLKKTTSERWAQLTLGENFNFSQETYKCEVCGEEGDFALKNDLAFKTAEKICGISIGNWNYRSSHPKQNFDGKI